MNATPSIQPRRPLPSNPALTEHLRHIEEANSSGALDRAAKLYSMAYLTFTIANTYVEEANDQLQPYGLVQKKVKTSVNNLMQSFDAYDNMMQSLIGGDQGALRQLCFDSDTLREMLDAFMINNIEVQRGPYYKAKLFLPTKNK